MTSSWQALGASLATDLERLFAARLRSVVAFGSRVDGHDEAPLATLALVTTLTAEDLEACAGLSAAWRHAGLATPLLLPEDEFRASLDVFPLEYGEIIRTHERIHGPDPFAGLAISPEDLRRACETQIKSHLLHLREGFIESGGRLAAVAALVTAAAPAFAALVRNVARLDGVETRDRQQATREGATRVGLSDATINAILALERPTSMPMTDPARLFPDYLAAVEHLARTVDTWRR
jgi:hypothetical protein